MQRSLWFSALVCAVFTTGHVWADSYLAPGSTANGIYVSAQANLFGAGHGSMLELPGVDGMLPYRIDFEAADGNVFTFTASGGTNCCSLAQDPTIGPDGGFGTGLNTSIWGYAWVSAVQGNSQLPLLGVFLPADPSTISAPPMGSYDYEAAPVRQRPALGQIFFIGDGLTGEGTGTREEIVAPAGASTLYLGFADAANFSGSPGAFGDNPGGLTVSVSLRREAPIVVTLTDRLEHFALEGIVVDLADRLEHYDAGNGITVELADRLEHTRVSPGHVAVRFDEALVFNAPPREPIALAFSEPLTFLAPPREPIALAFSEPLTFLAPPREPVSITFDEALTFLATPRPREIDVPGTLRFSGQTERELNIDVPGTLRFSAATACGTDWPAVASDFFGSVAPGWTIEGDADPIYSEDGIAAKDRGEGIYWYWVAPSEYLGDHSASFGSSLTYQMKISEGDDAAGAMVLIEGAGRSISATAGYVPGSDWTYFCYPLNTTGNWTLDGADRPATDAEIRAVLANVTSLKIRGEFSSSEDTGWLGMVSLGRAD